MAALRYAVAAGTTIGLEPGRATNQDAYATLAGEIDAPVGAQAWAAICLADGMGGMAAGEVASEAAVKAAMAEAARLVASEPLGEAEQAAFVAGWVHAANQQVCVEMDRRRAEGGCTFTGACLIGPRLAVAHVGDTRLYLLRGGGLLQLTNDHSLAMEHVRRGDLLPENVRTHPDRSTLTRSLGSRHPLPEGNVDTLAHSPLMAPVAELQPGDALLFCSDGLWEPVQDDEMARVLRHPALPLQRMVDALLARALQQGGADNATAVLLRLEPEPAAGDATPA